MKRRLLLSAVLVLVVFGFALVANEAAAQDLHTIVEPGYTTQIHIEFVTTGSSTRPATGGNDTQNLKAESLLVLEMSGLVLILCIAVAGTMFARRQTRSARNQ